MNQCSKEFGIFGAMQEKYLIAQLYQKKLDSNSNFGVHFHTEHAVSHRRISSKLKIRQERCANIAKTNIRIKYIKIYKPYQKASGHARLASSQQDTVGQVGSFTQFVPSDPTLSWRGRH